jgi:DNA polymerase-3 subunit chi
MMQISFYKTSHEVEKIACTLAEKCYHNNKKTLIIVPDVELQESLNKLLWTYSQKQFIPHGSHADPLPEKQPIYITHKFENPNKSIILILINPIDLIDIIFTSNEFERIIIIYNDNAIYRINKSINRLNAAKINFTSYIQNIDGKWVDGV